MSSTEDETNSKESPFQDEKEEDTTTFSDLGLTEVLCEACESLGWKTPSKIQKEAIPRNPSDFFALVLTPTRELAYQISEQFEKLGKSIGVKCVVLVGGMDMVSQALVLGKKPHIIIATPGRLIDHMENTKGFDLRSLKYLIMDEADRILNMDFEIEVDKILTTMTKKVAKLQRASLRDPVRVEVSSKYQTVDKLLQYYLFIPLKYKEMYLVHIINELAGNSFIIFSSTCSGTLKLALLLRNLGFTAIPLNGQMSQNKRLASLNKFKNKKTARAGRSGRAITFVCQYDVELYQRIETLIGKKLPLYSGATEEEVMVLGDRVNEAVRFAKMEMKDMEGKEERKGGKSENRQRMTMMMEKILLELEIVLKNRIIRKKERQCARRNDDLIMINCAIYVT
ncbi:DDX47 [Lepeophtheirus salmonis]|uniref:RNA helicase n=1 Tax=Lepeophtheirus salmonis TaxID=72036 RepID=A0A7R8H729_LEPSM|nr:DDX47 [Lepeophtheirus salmonis]CAF2912290.1 DDX47 [Lepeophtheirus salmonis]